MFANEYIKKRKLGENAHKDETFYRWFLKGELKITNAYIIYENYHYYPIPLSVQEDKKEKGNAYDLLFQNEEFDKQTKGIDGYVRFSGNYLYKFPVKKSLNFHHARDRERGTSKEGLIFNYESINEGQTFEGYIIGEDKDIKDFMSIIGDGIYYLGRSRNNQYGKIEFRLLDKEPVDFTGEIKTEIDDIQSAVITLLSDTIVYNEYGYSTTDIKGFEKAIGCKIKQAFIKQTEEEGFLSIWRLKTPQEVCFRAGSCFLVELKDGDIQRLRDLQKKGIGMRTHEGFGRFVIGWQAEENQITIKDEERTKPPRPEGAPPEKVKELIENIIKENLKKYIQIMAIKTAKDFNNLPPASLLAKLEDAVNKRELTKKLQNLKDKAKINLEKCRSKNADLYEYLTNFKVDVSHEIRQINKLADLCNEISYQPENDADFKKELEKIYLTTFLSTMRKKKKQEEKK
jgi:CRISPR-associated protein Csx10